MRLALAAALLGLTACQAQQEQAAAGSTSAIPSDQASARPPFPVSTRATDSFAIRAERNRTDMVAGCPHQNPETRPRGSNCFGIFPEQCGADRAAPWLKQKSTAVLRRRIEDIGPPEGVRFIGYREPVNADLRVARLNIELDAAGVIAKVDCY